MADGGRVTKSHGNQASICRSADLWVGTEALVPPVVVRSTPGFPFAAKKSDRWLANFM